MKKEKTKIHRRLQTDDGFGLDEPLNEEEFGAGAVVRGKHRIFFGNFKQEAVDDQTFSERASQVARKWTMEPWLFFTPGEKISRRKWRNVRNKRFSGLQVNGLPRHIHILTLEPWKAGSVLLRLENLIEKPPGKEETSKDRASSSYVTVDIRKIFVHHAVRLVRETTLAANHWLEEARQMDWSSRYIYPGSNDEVLPEDGPDYTDNVQTEESQIDISSEDSTMRTVERRRMKDRLKYHQYSSNKRVPRSVIEHDNYNETINDYIKTVQTKINETATKEDNKKVKLNTKPTENINNVYNEKRLKKHSSLDDTTDTTKLRSSTNSTRDIKNTKMEETQQDYLIYSKLTAKLNRNKSYEYDPTTDDFDDGITKSIYEMYYKRKPRKRTFKPFLRTSEEFIDTDEILKRNKKEKIYKEIDLFDSATCPTNERRAKGNVNFSRKRIKIEDNDKNAKRKDQYEKGIKNTVAPPLIKETKSKMSKEDDVGDDADYTLRDLDYESDDELAIHTLKKRSPKYKQRRDSSELPEQNEDFIFSLRPTQIRTFVVWFVEKKRY